MKDQAKPRAAGVIAIDPATLPLTRLDLDPEDFQSPLPIQNYHMCFSDEAIGMAVGVWDTTTMQEAFGPYPGDEFIVVLDGAFAIVDGDGAAVHGHAGQGACFRNAIPVSWKQDGYLRKIYLTLQDPESEPPEVASAQGGVVVLDRTETPVSLGQAAALHATRSRDVVFRNDSGNMLVTLCAWDAIAVQAESSKTHELLHVLQGALTLTDASGTAQVFGAGSTAFLPAGTDCTWAAEENTQAWLVEVTPGPTAAR